MSCSYHGFLYKKNRISHSIGSNISYFLNFLGLCDKYVHICHTYSTAWITQKTEGLLNNEYEITGQVKQLLFFRESCKFCAAWLFLSLRWVGPKNSFCPWLMPSVGINTVCARQSQSCSDVMIVLAYSCIGQICFVQDGIHWQCDMNKDLAIMRNSSPSYDVTNLWWKTLAPTVLYSKYMCILCDITSYLEKASQNKDVVAV